MKKKKIKSSYAIGKEFERKVKSELTKKGYNVEIPTRTQWSAKDFVGGRFDNFGYDTKRKRFIWCQAKKNKKDFKKDVIENLFSFNPLSIDIAIAYTEEGDIKIRVIRQSKITTKREYTGGDISDCPSI